VTWIPRRTSHELNAVQLRSWQTPYGAPLSIEDEARQAAAAKDCNHRGLHGLGALIGRIIKQEGKRRMVIQHGQLTRAAANSLGFSLDLHRSFSATNRNIIR
jgi:hypothetical protein